MATKKYSEEQILKMLKEIEGGATIVSVARSNAVNVQTLYRWRERFAGMSKSELQELRALQEENRRLRRIIANQAIDIEAYKELQKGKW